MGAITSTCPQRVSDALRWGFQLLTARQIETPRLDAELLLAHTLSTDRSSIYTRWEECLCQDDITFYTELIRRRAQHEPVAYLVGERAFFDIRVHVTRDVLIPRPETEHLVEDALAWADTVGQISRVVDVGTGSGAIAIALARHLPEACVLGLDVSWPALQVARSNVGRYSLGGRVELVQGDLLTAVSGPLDLVVANLPYIASTELPDLERNVVGYEPHLALDGGRDGLDLVRRLLHQLPQRLARPGLCLLEIDFRQAETVKALAYRQTPDACVSMLRDYAGLERVVRIARGKESHV